MGDDTLFMVMPVYNEEGVIRETILEWAKAFDALKIRYTILAINDGSRDGTKAMLTDMAAATAYLKVIHKENEGHGATILKGYESAIKSEAEWIFQTDSDAQFFPEDFARLWEMRGDGDFLLGFREKRHDPASRLIITSILRSVIRLSWGVKVHDANCPFRLMRKSALGKILSLIPEGVFAPNIFLAGLAAAKKDIRFKEVAIRHKERTSGKCSIRHVKLLKCAVRSWAEIMRFRP